MGKMRKIASPSTISIILITERQIWYICIGLHLLSSKKCYYASYSSNMIAMKTICVRWHWGNPNITLIKKHTEYLFFIFY